MTGSTSSVTRLSAVEKARLGIEILAAYARVRWLLWRTNLPAVVQTVRVRARRTAGRPLADLDRDGRRLGRAVMRMIARLPSESRCPVRSLVLLQVLSWHGVESDLVIAVRPREDLTLDAHAWIEVDGQPLLDAAPDYGRLVTL
jgi:Transglutaminase-like superfamily